MNVVPACIAAVVGLVAGGFLGPIIVRTPIRERLWLPGAHCTTCGDSISLAQYWPWTARILGVNNCTTCGTRIWSNAPWLEVLCAMTLGVVALRFGWSWALPAFLVFAFSSLAITVIDIRHHMIPNRIVYPTLFASLALLTIAAALQNDWAFLLRALIGMTGAWLFFFIVWFIYPKGMGFGDVRLALLIGLFTGWMGLGNVYIGIFAGLVLGAVSGLSFVVLRFVGMKDPIPYGPFLILGAFVSIFFAENLSPLVGG